MPGGGGTTFNLFWSSILNMVLPCKYTVSFLTKLLKTSGLAEGQTAVGEIITWRAYQLDEKKKTVKVNFTLLLMAS